MKNAMKVGATMWCKVLEISVAGLLGIAISGCGSDPKDQFASEDHPRDIHKVMYAHAAAGARRTSTLNHYHFDGAELNSLGCEELDLILSSTKADRPLYVYVDLPKADPVTKARHENVSAHLKEAGVDEKRIHLESGANPA